MGGVQVRQGELPRTTAQWGLPAGRACGPHVPPWRQGLCSQEEHVFFLLSTFKITGNSFKTCSMIPWLPGNKQPSNSLAMCEKGRPQTERAGMLFCELHVYIRRKRSAVYHLCLLNFLLSSLSACHTYISISLICLIRLFSSHCLLKLLSTINSDILRIISKETNPTEFGTDLSIPLPCASLYLQNSTVTAIMECCTQSWTCVPCSGPAAPHFPQRGNKEHIFHSTQQNQPGTEQLFSKCLWNWWMNINFIRLDLCLEVNFCYRKPLSPKSSRHLHTKWMKNKSQPVTSDLDNLTKVKPPGQSQAH